MNTFLDPHLQLLTCSSSNAQIQRLDDSTKMEVSTLASSTLIAMKPTVRHWAGPLGWVDLRKGGDGMHLYILESLLQWLM